MRKYAVQRLLLAIPTLFLVSVVAFSIIRLIPGDVAQLMLQDFAYASDIEELRDRLGLTQPIHQQYLQWMAGIFHGNFGVSLWNGAPVASALWGRLLVTFELAALSLFLTTVVAIPAGVWAALRQDKAEDHLLRAVAVFFLSVPHFWIATILLVIPAYYAGWAPSVTWKPFSQDPLGNLAQVILPAAILGLGAAAPLIRLTRAMVLEVLRQDYIRTAWSKGLSQRAVVLRHALKNALIPVVTLLGLRVPVVISGSVIIENVFGIPGVGRWLVEALTFRDYPQVQVAILFLASVVILVNLVVDLSYAWLDPRIRYG